MVECIYDLDDVFDSLGDKTRREILKMVGNCELSISDIATNFKMTFAGVSKHIKVLENAKLIIKRRKGKEQLVRANTRAIEFASEYLKRYEQLWSERMENLDKFIKEN